MAEVKGIYVVTITPFKENGSIDLEYTKKHIDYLISSGVHGLIPLGATGEFSSLTIDERKKYLEFFMEAVAGRVPVIVGAVSQNIDISIEISKHAKSVGASGVMILPAPGLHLSQDEIYNFYAYIDSQIDIPIMLYNNPGSSGVEISAETLDRLVGLRNVSMIKESTGDITKLTRTVDDHGDKLTVFCGCESLAYESFVMGAKAWVCVYGNVAPLMSVALYDLIVNKHDFASARSLITQALPFLRLEEESGELWQVVKYMLELQGKGKTYLRRPRGPISAEAKAAVDAIFAQNPCE